MNFVVQAWEESERGWGVRPDGLSIHLDRNHLDEFIIKYNASLPNDHVPDEYSRPSGRPVDVTITSDEILEYLKKRKLHEVGSIWLLQGDPITRKINEAIRNRKIIVE
jgi:hypothetical protein